MYQSQGKPNKIKRREYYVIITIFIYFDPFKFSHNNSFVALAKMSLFWGLYFVAQTLERE